MLFLILQKEGSKEGMDQSLMIFLILQTERRREVKREWTNHDIPYITDGREEGGKEGMNQP
jgi:hypothetical protein